MASFGYFSGAPSLRRSATAAIMATMTFLAGVGFHIVVQTPSGAAGTRGAFDIKTTSGGNVFLINEFGTTSMSGSLLVNDAKAGSGKITVYGSDGGSICVADSDGAGYTLFECNNGVCVASISTGSKCP